jgi:P27 family predicted phage terminase small subunit
MRGPPPKPTQLKIVAGNPGRYPLNEDEPQPDKKAPACPAWLTPEAKIFWREFIKLVINMRVMTVADRNALASLCVAMADLKEAVEKQKTWGLVVKKQNGDAAINPYFKIKYIALERAHKLMSEFGLTPAARSRIIAGIGYGSKEKGNEGEQKAQQSAFGRRAG